MDTMANAAVEGTLDDLVLSQMIDNGALKRKRAGRPAVGGRGAIWDQLVTALVSAGKPTKNGLPGVPYSVKNTVARLKVVWSTFVPGVEPGVAPTDWAWVSSNPAELAHAILCDLRTPDSAHRLLEALADAVRVLHPAEEETEALYRSASRRGTPLPLQPVPAVMDNFVAWPDWLRIVGHVNALAARPDNSPEAGRLLGWGRFVLMTLVPESAGGTPLDVMPGGGPGATCLADVLCLSTRPGEPRADNKVTVDKHGVLCMPGTAEVMQLGPAAQACISWALKTRESADHMERLLPRRLTADSVLARLSKGLLKGVLKGKVLSVRGCRLAWTVSAFAATLREIDKDMQRLGLTADVDALKLLSQGVHLAHVPSLKLRFPDDDVPVADLIMDAAV